MKTKSLVVIGGGAAGFFCAINAARRQPEWQVIILEKTQKLLSKVKVSGGGRCNVTHACFSIAEMVKNYPRGASFVKKSFHQFFTPDTIQWFLERGVHLHTEPDGRMFPVTNDAQTIIACLVAEANKYQVEIRTHAEVKSLKKESGIFTVEMQNQVILQADFVCVACGGFANAEKFNFLTALGHHIQMPVPSLFTFNAREKKITSLMGIVVSQAQVKINGTPLQQRGAILITHWGLSGPAILKLSAWGARILAEKKYDFTISVNWYPSLNENTAIEKLQQLRFERAGQKLINKNPFDLPARLWEFLIRESGLDTSIRWADVPAKRQNLLAKNICNYAIVIRGKTTFKEEFVTAGGIDLSEVDAHTMQSKIIPGLYFAGEILDVDGITGGFNFQHAWTSGWIAANSMATFNEMKNNGSNN
ncbi:MAG: flavoprotein [Niastella sp. SCN 39-18]|nr:NAD(P)/FAD-dependent oxidoreductase [Sphingobacteriales bacterium]ODT52366.1 MAG: flavoprotein [Niastella sp. SCN 39-18]OJW10362.1 MAG: flavoprotein [Sphingobacteriales bacterium 39-19]